jgi:hypothetical protein
MTTMEKSTLVDSLCTFLERVGRLSGDDLLDVSMHQFTTDNSFWFQRLITRKVNRFDRHEIVRQLTSLVDQTMELVHYVLDSKYLQIREGWPPHQLLLERMDGELRKLSRLCESLEKFQYGIRAQEQHYRKEPDKDVADKFEEIYQTVDRSLEWLAPVRAKLDVQIRQFHRDAAAAAASASGTSSVSSVSSSSPVGGGGGSMMASLSLSSSSTSSSSTPPSSSRARNRSIASPISIPTRVRRGGGGGMGMSSTPPVPLPSAAVSLAAAAGASQESTSAPPQSLLFR